MTRRPLAAIAGFALSVLAALPSSAAAISPPIALESKPIALDINDPDRRRVDRLIYRGGVVLSSSDPRFGGLSGLIILARGTAFLAISDRGYWVNGALGYDKEGNLNGVSGVSIEPIRGPAGQWLTVQPWRDAESLALWEDGGVIVAFEDSHRLWAYSGRAARPVRLVPPPRLYRSPRNGGIEALTALPGGWVFALTERHESNDGVLGWIGDQSGVWLPFTYPVEGDFRPTGATTLADGSVLVLERRFPPVGARLQLIPAEVLVAEVIEERGAVAPERVATFDGPWTLDNMEGIATMRPSDGRTRVYLLSDDNFSPLQRTLLMMFELEDAPAPDAASTPDAPTADADGG